ncbi:hypothetical protein CJJ09_001939 [Candidozyma auris]|nr:hypothetical protein CJJ09_001939 [[Candida] auris]
MQFSSVILASMAASMVSAARLITVTNGDDTYVETIKDAEDMSTPEGGYITYKLITGTRGLTPMRRPFGFLPAAAAQDSSAAQTSSAAVSSEDKSSYSAAAETSSAEVSSYEGAAGNLGVAAGVAGFAGVAAMFI